MHSNEIWKILKGQMLLGLPYKVIDALLESQPKALHVLNKWMRVSRTEILSTDRPTGKRNISNISNQRMVPS